MIKTLNIKNFKSIKELQLDCKRINLFIGEPNVGKSNILEALSMFSIADNKSEKNLDNFVRFNSFKNLFYDNLPKNNIEINTDIISAYFLQTTGNKFNLLFVSDYLNRKENIILKDLFFSNSNKFDDYFDKLFIDNPNPIKDFKSQLYKFYDGDKSSNYSGTVFNPPIKKYEFKEHIKINNEFEEYLISPFGSNLITIIQQNNEIYDEIASFFEEYGLELLYDINKNEFEIQKKINRIIYKYPFNLIADTLKRIIFYLTIVESNKKSTIILEEPETHSFPPYTKLLAQRISKDLDNQYFIATHSPYLLHNIIENTEFKDLNIIITYFEDFQTKIKVLKHKDIITILDDNIEIFYNLNKFLSQDEK